MNSQIVVLGSANADTLMRLHRLPRVGETVNDGTLLLAYGGKGANQAVAAARAGGRVAFAGCVGDDAHGHAIKANFQRDGINTDALLVRSDVPTGAALVLIDSSGDNSIAVAPGANHAFSPADVDRAAPSLDGAALLVLQMELTPAATRRALERAAAAHVPVLMNYAPASARPLPVTDAMTGLVVNEHEAADLCGFAVPDAAAARRAAQELLKRGPPFVVVTLGAHGAVVLSADADAHLPAFPADAVDTTGAGDVFCGALAVALVEQQPLLDAARFAAAASALSVTQAGAQPSAPRRAAINAFLAAHPA